VSFGRTDVKGKTIPDSKNNFGCLVRFLLLLISCTSFVSRTFVV